MENRLNHVSNSVSVFIEGMGFLGEGSIKPPDVIFKRVKTGGAAGEYSHAYGAVEELKAEAKFEVTNQVFYKALSNQKNATVKFANAIIDEYEARGERNVLTGGFDLEVDERKNGEPYKVTMKFFPHYWFQEISGQEMVEIDMKKNIVKIDGKDLLEETRKVVGG